MFFSTLSYASGVSCPCVHHPLSLTISWFTRALHSCITSVYFSFGLPVVSPTNSCFAILSTSLLSTKPRQPFTRPLLLNHFPLLIPSCPRSLQFGPLQRFRFYGFRSCFLLLVGRALRSDPSRRSRDNRTQFYLLTYRGFFFVFRHFIGSEERATKIVSQETLEHRNIEN